MNPGFAGTIRWQAGRERTTPIVHCVFRRVEFSEDSMQVRRPALQKASRSAGHDAGHRPGFLKPGSGAVRTSFSELPVHSIENCSTEVILSAPEFRITGAPDGE